VSRTAITPQRARWLAERILPHEPALRAWLGSRVARVVDVDDVVQESYAQLATLGDVDHVRDPRAYLFRVAHSLVLQQVRRARIVPIVVLAEVERLEVSQDELTPERHALAGQELNRIGALIAALPDKCRQAFVLRKIEGLPQRDIAARMGVSENTVEKHIGKGLRLLAEALGADAGDGARGESGPAGRRGGKRDPRVGAGRAGDEEDEHQAD